MYIVVENNEKKSTLRFPMEDVELKEQMHKIGITKISPVCRVTDCGQDKGLLKCLIGTEVKLDEVNFLSKRWTSLTPYEQEVMSEAASIKGIHTMKDLINLTYSLSGLSLLSDFSDIKKVGRLLYLDKHMGMSREEENSMDFEAYARQVFDSGKIKLAKHGVFIENEFRMVQVYDGRIFPFYVYDPSETIAIMELSNGAGDKEYVYLPTSSTSLGKVKHRLGVKRFEECRVTDMINLRLPENIELCIDYVSNTEDLEKLNELCRATVQLNDGEMKKLSMILDFLGVDEWSPAVMISKNLEKFEVIPGMTTNYEYGKYCAEQAGLLETERLLEYHMDFESYGADKRRYEFGESEFVDGGLVGTVDEGFNYADYNGECREFLEINEEDVVMLHLYNPLYGYLISEREFAGELEDGELVGYENILSQRIEECMEKDRSERGWFIHMNGSHGLLEKVISAFPRVECLDGKLYGVLECTCRNSLSNAEVSLLKECWMEQMKNGWGKSFEEQAVRTLHGELHVSFYNNDEDWCVMTKEELEMKAGVKTNILQGF